jgi:hypothetical protein
MSEGVPVNVICERLGKKDDQICSLAYREIFCEISEFAAIKLDSVELETLKIKDLKKIISGRYFRDIWMIFL